MTSEDSKLNTNSYISIGLLVAIISAAIWINNSIQGVQSQQIQQEKMQNQHNINIQYKMDEMKSRIDGLVTRPELEAKMSEIRLETSKLELQLIKAQIQTSPTTATQNRP